MIFICFFKFIGWADISLGVHIYLKRPYIDIHVPFGWVRIGWTKEPETLALNWRQCQQNSYGFCAERNLIHMEGLK